MRLMPLSVSWGDFALRLVGWRGLRNETRPPDFLAEFARRPGVRRLQWQPHGIGAS